MKKLLILTFIFTFALAACAPAAPAEPVEKSQNETLTVMTHDSFAVSEEVVAAFEAEHNAKVVFLASGDTGSALNKAILTRPPSAIAKCCTISPACQKPIIIWEAFYGLASNTMRPWQSCRRQ